MSLPLRPIEPPVDQGTEIERDVQKLKIEVGALRDLRRMAERAGAEWMAVVKKEHEAQMAELEAEHAEHVEQLAMRISELEQCLTIQKASNHAEELEEAHSEICELEERLARNKLTAQALDATLRGGLQLLKDAAP